MADHTSTKNRFIEYIDKIVINHRVSHAYLIEVDNYDDDFFYIISFIKMILSGMTYNEMIKSDMDIFRLIDNNDYPDLTFISSDSSVIKKSSLKDLIKDFNNKSLLNNKRIYVIKEAEKLNDSSANTILKFLEEPEDDIIAILVTNNRYNVISTIQSRCQIISVKENYFLLDIDDNLFDFIGFLLNPNAFFINYNELIKSTFVDKNVIKELLLSSEKLFINYINGYIDSESNIFCILSKYSNDFFINIISIIEDEVLKLNYNINYKLWLDSLFLKLLGG